MRPLRKGTVIPRPAVLGEVEGLRSIAGLGSKWKLVRLQPREPQRRVADVVVAVPRQERLREPRARREQHLLLAAHLRPRVRPRMEEEPPVLDEVRVPRESGGGVLPQCRVQLAWILHRARHAVLARRQVVVRERRRAVGVPRHRRRRRARRR